MRDHDALIAFLADRDRMPFDWRRNDCARFAAGAVRAQTGRNPLKGLRWGSAAGAARVLARLGSMEAAVSARLRPIAPAAARRGDIAGVPDAVLGLSLLVVEGETLVGPGAQGTKRLARSAMTHAWSAEDE